MQGRRQMFGLLVFYYTRLLMDASLFEELLISNYTRKLILESFYYLPTFLEEANNS